MRRARTQRGFSLSELARRSTIGKATLSQLEAGTGNPTIETVFSLSRALELPISDLLDHRRPAGLTVVRAADVEPLSGEAVDLRLLRRLEVESAVLEVYDQQVRPEGRQSSFGHVGVEHTVVQSGRLGVEVDGERVELDAGDYICFDAVAPHNYTALGGPVRSVLLLQYRGGQQPELVKPHPLTPL
ncbi:MAG TPA: helix-turn-helix domain-containing protein [Pseudonocardiaceae bacterium]|nr:helix-turn-helix domain-containing protein [Pseudonocardiaceae bacterium]